MHYQLGQCEFKFILFLKKHSLKIKTVTNYVVDTNRKYKRFSNNEDNSLLTQDKKGKIVTKVLLLIHDSNITSGL